MAQDRETSKPATNPYMHKIVVTHVTKRLTSNDLFYEVGLRWLVRMSANVDQGVVRIGMKYESSLEPSVPIRFAVFRFPAFKKIVKDSILRWVHRGGKLPNDLCLKRNKNNGKIALVRWLWNCCFWTCLKRCLRNTDSIRPMRSTTISSYLLNQFMLKSYLNSSLVVSQDS